MCVCKREETQREKEGVGIDFCRLIGVRQGRTRNPLLGKYQHQSQSVISRDLCSIWQPGDGNQKVTPSERTGGDGACL